MRHFRATVEYDGTDFSGFQWQHGARTVQEELEKAILARTSQAVRITGAGRTDAGVHAAGQVVSFAAETNIPADRLALALNTALPPDISIRDATETGPAFSARFSASSRVYVYLVWNGKTPSPLWRRYAAFCPRTLDVKAMREAAKHLLGEQDFAAFAAAIEPNAVTMRHVMTCRIGRRGDMVVVRIEANAFLRGMVRCIVGTLIDVGRGVREPDCMPAILRSRDRALAGPSAPARGLCLKQVKYGYRKNYMAEGPAIPAFMTVEPRSQDETSAVDRATNGGAGIETDMEE